MAIEAQSTLLYQVPREFARRRGGLTSTLYTISTTDPLIVSLSISLWAWALSPLNRSAAN